MRSLIYVPVIHTSADLGSLAKDVTKRGIAGLGEDIWKEHKKTVDSFWDAIFGYFDSIDVPGLKIYQDGMIAEGEVGRSIVEEGLKSGSRNYELVSKLLNQGAILVKTEDFKLVKEERDRLLSITQTKSLFKRVLSFLKYKLIKDSLLNKRDRFIANRINETLAQNETGILFIGAYHNVKNKLSNDIRIREIKDVQKVRDYHSLLPFYHKHKKHFEELSKYLREVITDVKN
jgi:hypothetical protein